MSFLLDTNVVSEWVKPRPDPGVAAWLADADEDSIFISVVTLAELRHGVQRLGSGRRRTKLDEWLRFELPSRFEGRILPIDSAVAERWGQVVALSDGVGRPIGAMDAVLAATAQVFSLSVVTRNVGDFDAVLQDLVNPWIT